VNSKYVTKGLPEKRDEIINPSHGEFSGRHHWGRINLPLHIWNVAGAEHQFVFSKGWIKKPWQRKTQRPTIMPVSLI
jgi:hypothetical protein